MIHDVYMDGLCGMGYKEAEAVASKKRSLCNGKLVLPEIGQRLRAY